MIEIKGNILDVQQGFVCHQVNCQGVMGAGLAKGIRLKWPRVYNDYMSAFQRGDLKLGQVVFTTIAANKLYIANLCGQHDYGSPSIKRPWTDYDSLSQCLSKVEDWRKVVGEGKLPVYIPYKIGCGLGGGDWSVVEGIIKRKTPTAVIVKL